MNHEKSCGTVIVNQGKVLLIAAKDDDGELFWSFPKGHQEDGETDAETALRETHEEVGLEVEIVDDQPIIVSHPIHGSMTIKDIYLFLARPKTTGLHLQSTEVEIAKWVPSSEVDRHLTDYYLTAWQEVTIRLGA